MLKFNVSNQISVAKLKDKLININERVYLKIWKDQFLYARPSNTIAPLCSPLFTTFIYYKFPSFLLSPSITKIMYTTFRYCITRLYTIWADNYVSSLTQESTYPLESTNGKPWNWMRSPKLRVPIWNSNAAQNIFKGVRLHQLETASVPAR